MSKERRKSGESKRGMPRSREKHPRETAQGADEETGRDAVTAIQFCPDRKSLNTSGGLWTEKASRSEEKRERDSKRKTIEWPNVVASGLSGLAYVIRRPR